MPYSVAMMVAAALFVSACAEPPADDSADRTVELETPAVDAANPDADAPSPGDRPDAGEGARGGDDASDEASGETGGEVATAIPSRFHGEWNADRAACGSGQSETRLRISADRIRFYESVGVVREVDIESDRAITVTAEYQGEGDTWVDERRFTLSPDGGSLSVSGGSDIVRHRCP